MKDRRSWRFSHSMTALALACSLLVLASCRLSLPGDCSGKCVPSSPPQTAVPVDFNTSVTYADVLRELTNLGVQPTVFCGYQSDLNSGNAIQGSSWLPAGQRERFQHEHLLFVMPTIAAPSDWNRNVFALPSAHRDPRTATQAVSCTDGTGIHSTASAPPGAPDVLTLDPTDNQVIAQIGTYAYVTFAAGVDYDTALYDISNLGLRLADPCYEQSFLTHQHPEQWHPMGQEITFSYSRALVVAPAPLISATVWRDQLRKLPDVAEEISYHPVC